MFINFAELFFQMKCGMGALILPDILFFRVRLCIPYYLWLSICDARHTWSCQTIQNQTFSNYTIGSRYLVGEQLFWREKLIGILSLFREWKKSANQLCKNIRTQYLHKRLNQRFSTSWRNNPAKTYDMYVLISRKMIKDFLRAGSCASKHKCVLET